MKKVGYTLSTLALSMSLLCSTPLLTYAADSSIESTAASLYSGTALTGNLTFKSDVQYYKISPTKAGQIYLSLENATAQLEAQIVDTTGKQIGYYNTYISSQKSINVDAQPGTYYIKVSGTNWDKSTKSATFTIKSVYPTSQAGQESTSKLNQTLDNALSLKSGQSFNGKLSSSVDVNYYKFMSEDDGHIAIRLENLATPIKIQVLDKNQNKVSEGSSNSTGNFVVNNNLPKGTYYIKISASEWKDSSTDGSYKIYATYTSKKIVRDDLLEPNDTFENAYRLHSGVPYQMTLSSNVDVNYYKIDIAQNDILHAEFNQISNPITVEVLDPKGNTVGYLYDSSKALDVPLTKGTYYIRITPTKWDDRSSVSFSMKANFPEDQKIDVKVNGVSLITDQPPVINNGRTLVPLRSIMEALGATIYWDETTRTVTAIKGSTNITIPLDSSSATINGRTVDLDVPATTMNGRTMVPIRFLSEGLQAQVNWDKENSLVNVNYDNNASGSSNTNNTFSPTLTQNDVTVSIDKVSIINNQAIFNLKIKNNTGDFIKVNSFEMNQIDSTNTIQTTKSPEDVWVNKINPSSTISGTLTTPFKIDPQLTLKLNVKINQGSSTNVFQFEVPIE